MIGAVLHVIDDASLGGGAQRLVLDLLTNCRKVGWRPVLACPRGELAERARSANIPVTVIAFKSRLSFGTVAALILALRRHRASVLHSHLPMSNFHAHVAAWLTGVAHICTIHGEGSVYTDRFARFLSVARRTGAVCVSVSAAAARSLQRRIGCNRIPHIYNGIECNYIRTVPEPEWATGYPVVGCVGRLHRHKGQDVLILAFPQILEQFPEATLALVGDGEERHALETSARRLGIEKRVRFYGYQHDIRPLLRTFTICVVPSRQESFGLAILEAGLSGKPIVASDVGGIPEVIQNRRTGLLVPPDSPDALGNAVLTLLRDPHRAERLAKAMKERVREQFSIDHCLGRYSEVYTDTLRKQF